MKLNIPFENEGKYKAVSASFILYFVNCLIHTHKNNRCYVDLQLEYLSKTLIELVHETKKICMLHNCTGVSTPEVGFKFYLAKFYGR